MQTDLRPPALAGSDAPRVTASIVRARIALAL